MTDLGEYKPLTYPSVLKVGREPLNSIRPEGLSVSKKHAIIEITGSSAKKCEIWIEDLGSRYGTFCGESPLDMEKVSGRMKAKFGYYLRFGNSQKYFRLLETIPPNVQPSLDQDSGDEDVTSTVAPAKSISKPLRPSLVKENSSNTLDNQFSTDFTRMSDPRKVPRETNKNLSSSVRDVTKPQPNHSYETARINQRRGYNTIDNDESNNNAKSDSNNMLISVNYPASRQSQPPVSITIDPRKEQSMRHSDQRLQAPLIDSNPDRRYSPSSMEGSDRHTFGYGSDQDSSPHSIGRSKHFPEAEYVDNYETENVTDRDSVADRAWTLKSRTNDRVEFRDSEELFRNSVRSEGYNEYYTTTLPDRIQGYGKSQSKALDPIVELDGSLGSPESAQNRRSRQSRQQLRFSDDKASQPMSIPKPIPQSYRSAEVKITTDRASGGVRNSAEKKRKAPSSTTEEEPVQSKDLLSAVAPEEVPLARRSWPEELGTPSTELIGELVDRLLDFEEGTTMRQLMQMQADMKLKLDALSVLEEEDMVSYKQRLLSELNPVRCALPEKLPSAVLSEALAEGLLANSGKKDKEKGVKGDEKKWKAPSSTTAQLEKILKELNELLKVCLKGTQIESPNSSADPTSMAFIYKQRQPVAGVNDFDAAVESTLFEWLERVRSRLEPLLKSAVVVAVERHCKKERVPVLPLLEQAVDGLEKIGLFVTRKLFSEERVELSTKQVYEVVSLSVSAVLNNVDACNSTLWELSRLADEQTMQYMADKSGGVLKNSLSAELGEMRRSKLTSEATAVNPLVGRIRQQEAMLREKRLWSLERMLNILLGFQLKSSFLAWKRKIRILKRQSRKLSCFADVMSIIYMRPRFKKWKEVLNSNRLLQKALQRLVRVPSRKLKENLRKRFFQWRLASSTYQVDQNSSEMVAQLRLQLSELSAALSEIRQKEGLPSLLAAERALNRELSAENMELRNSVRSLEEKLISISNQRSNQNTTAKKELMGREEEFAECRRENSLLRQELKKLNSLRETSKNQDSTTVDLPSNEMKGKTDNIAYPPRPESNFNAAKLRPIYDRNTGLPAISPQMTKTDAKLIILNEVRLLRQSQLEMDRDRRELQQELQSEYSRNSQLTLTNQALEKRIISHERSSKGLRELLRQRFGASSLLDLKESLERTGAGSAALSENNINQGGFQVGFGLDSVGSGEKPTSSWRGDTHVSQYRQKLQDTVNHNY